MQTLTSRKWFYPLIYLALVIISFLPLYTERLYDPRDTQQVIFEIISRAAMPYVAWGWVFHVATLAVIALAVWNPQVGGRVAAAYFGLNYLVIAFAQTRAQTPSYGFAVHTGAMVAEILLALLWLWVAWKDRLRLSFRDAPRWRWILLPFALLVFWSPLTIEGTTATPNFDPLLLLTSPDYGLAYCFLTPGFSFPAHPGLAAGGCLRLPGDGVQWAALWLVQSQSLGCAGAHLAGRDAPAPAGNAHHSAVAGAQTARKDRLKCPKKPGLNRCPTPKGC